MKRFIALSSVILLALGSLALRADATGEPAPTSGEGLTLLGVHPWAEAQPTATGRALRELEVIDGEVFVGFGNWAANTGPIPATSWSPAAHGWTHHLTVETEAIEVYRVLSDGRVLIPYIDPRGHYDLALGAVGGEWQKLALGPTREAFWHAFDAAETSHGLWLVGSKRGTGQALVMHSADGGATWEESLVTEGTGRFYFAAVLDDVLYVQAGATGYRFDGSWQVIDPPVVSGLSHSPVEVGGRAAVLTRSAEWPQLLTFDGTGASTVSDTADWWDLSVDEHGVAYALRTGAVQRSTDLLTWETVTEAVPADARSLAVADGQIYLGTATSELWVTPLPTAPEPQPEPEPTQPQPEPEPTTTTVREETTPTRPGPPLVRPGRPGSPAVSGPAAAVLQALQAGLDQAAGSPGR